MKNAQLESLHGVYSITAREYEFSIQRHLTPSHSYWLWDLGKLIHFLNTQLSITWGLKYLAHEYCKD